MARTPLPTIDDVPELPAFPSSPFDVRVELSDGTIEIIKVQARGPAAAWMTALYTVQKWSHDKIALLKQMGH